MNIKSYSEFINESNTPPGVDTEKTIVVSLNDDEVSMFREETILSNLIGSQKVTVVGNKLYYYDDEQIINTLNQFFPEKIVNTLEEYDKEIDKK